MIFLEFPILPSTQARYSFQKPPLSHSSSFPRHRVCRCDMAHKVNTHWTRPTRTELIKNSGLELQKEIKKSIHRSVTDPVEKISFSLTNQPSQAKPLF